MSAESEEQICNIALTRIGHTQLSGSLSSAPGKAGDLCRLYYKLSRDALLRRHPWNFAIKRAALASDTTAPSFEYDYAFALPSDCLKVIRTSWEATGWASLDTATVESFWTEPNMPYRIERHGDSTHLLCNETTVSIEYIARMEDTAKFDPLFTDCLAQLIAAEMAMPLSDNQNLAKSMWEVYTNKLAEARSMDSQEGSPRDVLDTSGWLQARI